MPRPHRTGSALGGDPPSASVPAMSTMPERSSSSHSRDAQDKHDRPHSKRRKARSLLRRYKQISLRHTWLNPLFLVLIILVSYFANPGPQNPLHRAIFLSYPLGPEYPGGPNMYGKGKHDFTFVAFYVIVLSFTREFFTQRVIRPMAIRAGITSRARQYRFMEQVYTAMYFSVFGPFGLYVMSRGSLWYFNTTAMFEGYPHREHEGVFKAYYLLQASYWSQQAIVLMLMLEKPRKDFKELVLHHIITLALIFLSYRFHFAKMGIAVYITHDISDFFLATSKTLNYIDSIIVGPYFALFMGIWIYLRHYINLRILWATATEFKTVGPFELNWEAQQYKCALSQYITFALLASLQAVNLFWLFLIFRIAYRFAFNSDLSDDRSDDEDEEEEEEEELTAQDVKKTLENNTGMKTDKPVLLVNGHAAELDAQPEGIRARRKA